MLLDRTLGWSPYHLDDSLQCRWPDWRRLAVGARPQGWSTCLAVIPGRYQMAATRGLDPTVRPFSANVANRTQHHACYTRPRRGGGLASAWLSRHTTSVSFIYRWFSAQANA